MYWQMSRQNDYDKNLSNFIINGSLIKSFRSCYVFAARFCKDENIALPEQFDSKISIWLYIDINGLALS